MSGELAHRSDVPPTLADQMQLSQALAKSGLLPDHLRGKPENVLAIMYAAQSVDVPIWQAMQGMQVISGKVGMAADLHRALILRAGHVFRVVESSDTSATVVVIRRDDPDRFEHRATFTKEDAERASLWGKGGWKSYPKAMLVARATTLVARNACSDVIAGMAYTAEELGAEVDEDGRVITQAPAGRSEDRPAASRAQLPPIPAPDPQVLEVKRQIVAAADRLGISVADLNADFVERLPGCGTLAEADLPTLGDYLGLLCAADEGLVTVADRAAVSGE